jgi:hypothetical protein
VELRWLQHKWERAKEKNSANIEKPEQVWQDTPTDENRRLVKLVSILPPPVTLPSPNKHHPWVRKIMEDMPHFSPMIMFRLCDKKCYLGTLHRSLPSRLQLAARGEVEV